MNKVYKYLIDTKRYIIPVKDKSQIDTIKKFIDEEIWKYDFMIEFNSNYTKLKKYENLG